MLKPQIWKNGNFKGGWYLNIPGGVLRISSDRDDRSILGLKVLIPRSFWVGKYPKELSKFGNYWYFFGWLDLSKGFLQGFSWYSKQFEDYFVVVPKYPGCVILRIQVQPNVFIFCVISFNNFWKFLLLRNSAWDFLGGVIILVHSVIQGSFWVLSEALWMFLGFDFSPPFDHPCQ